MTDLPLPQPQVMPPPRLEIEDTTRVTNPQYTDLVGDGPADHGLRGFVLGLSDPPPMPTLHQLGPTSVLAPPPRPPPPLCGCPAGGRPTALLRVSEVLAVFGPDGPP
nr:hypothetical protein [Plantactinospora mayteni]